MIAAGRGRVRVFFFFSLFSFLKGEAYGGLTTLPQRLQTGEYVGGTNLICLKNRVGTVLRAGKGNEYGRRGKEGI